MVQPSNAGTIFKDPEVGELPSGKEGPTLGMERPT